MECVQKMFMKWVCLCLAQDESVDSTSKVLVSIMMSESILPGTMERLISHLTSAGDCQKHDPSDKNMGGTQDASHIWQFGCANRICGEPGSFRRGKHSAALFHNPSQGVRMTMQCDFEYLLEDDVLKHINTQLQRRSERHGRTPEFKDSNLNNLVMLNCDH